MKKGKHILLIIAVMLLVMTAPAFAAETREMMSTYIEVTTMVTDIIVVTVPGNVNVVINPYAIPVDIGGAQDGKQQIYMEKVAIHNQSAAPVEVDVSLLGEVDENSGISLVATTTQGSTSKAKNAFIYFEIHDTDNPENVTWDPNYDPSKHVVLRTSEKTKKNIVTLDAGDENASAGNKCYGAFRLTGDCIAEPREPWTEDDSISAVISFTFRLTSTRS